LSSAPALAARARPFLSKVPEITVAFWIVKLLTTAMGEATSDYMVFHMNPYLAVAMGFLVLMLALALQLRLDRYVAWTYWFVVVMVAVFGTMVADAAHIVLGIPYLVTSLAFSITLAAVFALWYLSERTLSIHSIRTPRRELFYWATVMATFALGTALGDMTASTLHLGYLASAVLFFVLFLVPFAGRRWFGWAEVFSFWFSYVITRPLGASVADYFGMSPAVGGLGVNRLVVSAIFTLFIVFYVGRFAVTRSDIQEEPTD